MDIRFYDLDFNLIYILPEGAENTGCISSNFTVDFDGFGKLEVHFTDRDLYNIVREYCGDLILSCSDFQGVVTSYIDDGIKTSIYGYGLSYLLNRHVVIYPSGTGKTTGSARAVIYEKIAQMQTDGYFTWLTVTDTDTGGTEREYEFAEMTQGGEWVKEICQKCGCGFNVTADFKNRKYTFTILDSTENPLMLSQNNLNAYDMTHEGDAANAAVGGWYFHEYPDTALKLNASNGYDERTVLLYNGNPENFGLIWEVTTAGNIPISGLVVGDLVVCKDDKYYRFVKIEKDEKGFLYHVTADSGKTGIHKKEIKLSAASKTEAEAELAEAKRTAVSELKTRNIAFGTDYNIGDIVRVQTDYGTVKKVVKSVFISSEGISRIESPTLEEMI